MRSLRGGNAHAVINRLNPIAREWAAYYRTQFTGVSSGELTRRSPAMNRALGRS